MAQPFPYPHELAPGEPLRWQGAPRRRAELLNVWNWLFPLVWIASSIGWMVLVNALAVGPRSVAGLLRMEPDSVLPLVGAIAVLAGAAMLIGPVRAIFRAGRTVYAITDRRLLRIERGNRLRTLSVPLRRIDSVIGSRTTPGWGTVRLSATTIQGGRPVGSGAFYLRGVPEAATAYALLGDGVPISLTLTGAKR